MPARKKQVVEVEETEEQKVAKLVYVNDSFGHLCFDLATNPEWEPDYIDESLGVTYQTDQGEDIIDPQVPIAEKALALRVEQELAPRLTLQEWVIVQEQRLGGERRSGLPRLAAALVGITYTREAIEFINNERDVTGKKLNAYRNELRKLEEYKQGKYKNASGERRERIANLKGGEIGNPYAESNVIFHATMRSKRPVTIGVTGLWMFSKTYVVRKYDTQIEETAFAKTVLLNNGYNHVETVIVSVNEGANVGTILLMVYALHAEIVSS